MLLWIYPILASRFATRFVTILGKKRGPKGNNHWRKIEIEASLDLILIWWKEREMLQRERGKRRSEKALWKGNANLARERQNQALTYNQTRSRPVPCGPFLPAPRDAAPHDVAHTSARNGQLNRNPPVRAPSEGFRQGLGENWGKTNELEKTEYN
jgi:hypothetical protein